MKLRTLIVFLLGCLPVSMFVLHYTSIVEVHNDFIYRLSMIQKFYHTNSIPWSFVLEPLHDTHPMIFPHLVNLAFVSIVGVNFQYWAGVSLVLNCVSGVLLLLLSRRALGDSVLAEIVSVCSALYSFTMLSLPHPHLISGFLFVHVFLLSVLYILSFKSWRGAELYVSICCLLALFSGAHGVLVSIAVLPFLFFNKRKALYVWGGMCIAALILVSVWYAFGHLAETNVSMFYVSRRYLFLMGKFLFPVRLSNLLVAPMIIGICMTTLSVFLAMVYAKSAENKAHPWIGMLLYCFGGILMLAIAKHQIFPRFPQHYMTIIHLLPIACLHLLWMYFPRYRIESSFIVAVCVVSLVFALPVYGSQWKKRYQTSVHNLQCLSKEDMLLQECIIYPRPNYTPEYKWGRQFMRDLEII